MAIDETTRARIGALAAQGLSQRAIAEELGLSRGAVWRALHPQGRPCRQDVLPAGQDALPTGSPGSSASHRPGGVAQEPDLAELAAAGWLGLGVLGVLTLISLLCRGPGTAASRLPAAGPAPQPELGGLKPSELEWAPATGGWVVLETGQVVWRGPRASVLLEQ